MSLLVRKFIQRTNVSKDLRKVMSNSGWLIFDKLVRLLLGLLVTAWVARYLGPEKYGELAYVLAILAIFQTISILGMDGILVRDIAKDENQAPKLLGTVFLLRIMVGILCWILAVLVMVVLNGWLDQSVLITALAGGILLFQSADTVDLWFQSQSQSKRTVAAKLSAYIISNSLKVVLILHEASLMYFAVMVTIEGILSAIGLYISYSKYKCVMRWKLDKILAGKLLKESWPFIFSGVSIIIYMRVDQVLIKEIIGVEQLGIYAAVLPLAMLWSFIPTTISISLAPYIARKKQTSHMEYEQTLKNVFFGFSIIGWVICIPISIMSYIIVDVLFGQEFISGAKVLSIIIFSNLFINMGVAQSLWILNEGKSKISLYKTLVGAVVCLISNLILIPSYGLTGAAISSLLAQAFSTTIANFVFCPHILKIQVKSLLLIR